MDGSINPPNPKQRYGDLKVPLGLVPSASIIYEALALDEGARKYGPYNWRDKAVEAMTYVHAAERHMRAWLDGEDLDPKSGKPHLGHAKACLGIIADAIETGNLIDNRPLPAPTGELLAAWEKVPAPLDPLSSDFDHFDGEEVPATSWPYPQDLCPLDGRNCLPDHDHRLVLTNPLQQALERHRAALGEGDETTMYARQALTDPKHIHRWRVLPGVPDHTARMECPECGVTRPITDQKPGQHAIDFSTPEAPVRMAVELIDGEKYPCHCRDHADRCRVENGLMVGNNVFCCKAEAGQ